jgi:hypothetical protein
MVADFLQRAPVREGIGSRTRPPVLIRHNEPMSATSSDYEWVAGWHGWPMGAYCLTFLRGLMPGEVLDRLNVQDRARILGAAARIEPSMEAWNAHRGAALFVAVTEADGWSAMVEENGFIGVTEHIMAAVSNGTTTVSHFRNVNALDGFLWLEDGEMILQFEPLFPRRRSGTRADDDDIVAELIAAGFDVREGEERTFDHHTEAAFAFAERITGVRVTPEFLGKATYTAGCAPLPPPPVRPISRPIGLRRLPAPPASPPSPTEPSPAAWPG